MSPSIMFRQMVHTPWTVMIGIAIGVAIAPGGGFDWAWSAYDGMRPVIVTTGKLIERSDNSITVLITGEKLRDCQFLAIRAYAVIGAQMTDINTERTDRPMTGITKPTGRLSMGYWRAWPVEGAQSVQWWVSHSCAGRLVITKVAEVGEK